MKTTPKVGPPARLPQSCLHLWVLFLQNPGRTLSKTEIVERIWGGRAKPPRAIVMAVSKVRELLSGDETIRTIRGSGYRYEPARLRSKRNREIALRGSRSRSFEKSR